MDPKTSKALLERMALCRQQIRSAKSSLKFWYDELNLVTDALAEIPQARFSFCADLSEPTMEDFNDINRKSS